MRIVKLRSSLPSCLRCCAIAVVALAGVILATGNASAERKAPPDAARAAAGLLEERLAAGEFGPAVDAAGEIDDLTDRVRQLRAIASAQRRSQDFAGAAATARQIPDREQRARERAAVAREQSQGGGGGSNADFTELIELITSTIDPTGWEDVGGPGSMREYNTGVYVDPNGLMRQLTKEQRAGALESVGRRSRTADLNEDLARSSPLRMVSLKRLEGGVAERLATGRSLPETFRRLAGLTQVRYVFVDPSERELIIAGPAEAWRYDDEGRAVGRDSGRPLLDLDDLVVVLRAFAPGGDSLFGCSINTRDENLKRVMEFVEASNRSGPLRPGQLGKWLKELQSRLGLQDIVVHGVPADTRVARVLVDADYKMKLIGVKKLDGGPDMPSYFDLLRKAGQTKGAPLEALRWWLTMKYDAIVHSPDRTAFELQGSSVLVQSENQFVNAHGQHVPTGVSEPLNRRFAENFTRHYDDLARREPVFADLKNIFDLALVAALCRRERLHERADWDLGAFARDGAYRPAAVYAPKVIESVINHQVYGGKDIVVQVAGGVQTDLAAVAGDESLARESTKLRDLARRSKLPEGRWWWDAAK